MMVKKFGFQVHEVTALYLINLLANIILAPLMGHAVSHWGERNALIFEYAGLICVFLTSGGVYYFGWSVLLASMLYMSRSYVFGSASALKTYFQKISNPADILGSSSKCNT